jgi:hypothetical protein
MSSPGDSQAIAYLDGNKLPYGPNSLSWDYTLNTASFDTLGGRVLQILSVKIDTMTLQGDAANRNSLILLYYMVNLIQNKQIQTQTPVTLSLPTRGWQFSVWVRSFPQMGWDYATVTYPYSLQLEIDQNSYSIDEISSSVTESALGDLADSIGFSSTWTGIPGGTGGLFTVDSNPLDLPDMSQIATDLSTNASGINNTVQGA